MKLSTVLVTLTVLFVGASVTACASNDEHVANAVQVLKDNKHKIDQVPNDEGKLVNYAGWETESETTVVEVVVVIPGSNCKIEYQSEVLFGDLGTPYVDEGRNTDGTELDLPDDFPTDNPSPKQLEDYLVKGADKDVFAFCADKPYKHSPHAED